jgi:hypothetical protein
LLTVRKIERILRHSPGIVRSAALRRSALKSQARTDRDPDTRYKCARNGRLKSLLALENSLFLENNSLVP